MNFVSGGNEDLPHIMVLNTHSLENSMEYDADIGNSIDMEGSQYSSDASQNDVLNSSFVDSHPLSVLEGLENLEAVPQTAADAAQLYDTESPDEEGGFASIPDYMYEDWYQEYAWSSPVEGEIADWAKNLPPGSPTYTDSSDEWSQDESSYAPGEYSYDADDDNTYSSIDVPPQPTHSDEATDAERIDTQAAQPTRRASLSYVHLAIHDPPAAQRVLQNVLALIDAELSDRESTRSPSPVAQTSRDHDGSTDPTARQEPVFRPSPPAFAVRVAQLIEQHAEDVRRDKERFGLQFNYSSPRYSPVIKPVRVFFPPPRPQEVTRSETASTSSSTLNDDCALLEEIPELHNADEDRESELSPTLNHGHYLLEDQLTLALRRAEEGLGNRHALDIHEQVGGEMVMAKNWEGCGAQF